MLEEQQAGDAAQRTKQRSAVKRARKRHQAQVSCLWDLT